MVIATYTHRGLTVPNLKLRNDNHLCILLLICASSYLHTRWDPDASLRGVHKDTGYQKGLTGVGWKLARIGERKSPYVAFLCAFFSFYVLFLS